jgi:hypothetical protein
MGYRRLSEDGRRFYGLIEKTVAVEIKLLQAAPRTILDPSQTLDDPGSALDSRHFAMAAVNGNIRACMSRSGVRGYGRHFPLSHPVKKFIDIIGRTCGMNVCLKLNYRIPEDGDHEAFHARPIDAARGER